MSPREAEAQAVAGEEEEGEGHTVATPGTTTVTNQQQHIPQHHIISLHTQLRHVRDTMETLLQIEGKVA